MLCNLGPDDRALFAQVLPPGFLEQFVLGAWKEQWAPMRPFLLD
jgi:hypothetical protein